MRSLRGHALIGQIAPAPNASRWRSSKVLIELTMGELARHAWASERLVTTQIQRPRVA